MRQRQSDSLIGKEGKRRNKVVDAAETSEELAVVQVSAEELEHTGPAR